MELTFVINFPNSEIDLYNYAARENLSSGINKCVKDYIKKVKDDNIVEDIYEIESSMKG